MKKSGIRSNSTRRGFIGKTVALGGYLFVQGLGGKVLSAIPADSQTTEPISSGSMESDDFPGIAANSPIVVVAQSVSRDIDPRACTWLYIEEILHRAGLFFEITTTSLAELDSGRQGTKGSAIVENNIGKGRAFLLAPDLIFSIVHTLSWRIPERVLPLIKETGV